MYGLNGRGHAIRGRGIGARFSSPRNIQNSKNALSTLYCRHQVAGDSSLPSRKESVCSVEIRSREQPPTCLENVLSCSLSLRNLIPLRFFHFTYSSIALGNFIVLRSGRLSRLPSTIPW